MRADGSRPAQLTRNTAHDEGPAWSPDGRLLAFTSGPDDKHGDIHVMPAAGGDARRLTTYANADESPDWQAIPAPRSDARCGGLGRAGRGVSDVRAAGRGLTCATARTLVRRWLAAQATAPRERLRRDRDRLRRAAPGRAAPRRRRTPAARRVPAPARHDALDPAAPAAPHGRPQRAARLARAAPARARQLRLGPRDAGGARRAALPGLRADRVAAADRAARRGRARPAHRHGAARRRARRPQRPPPAAAARPDRARRGLLRAVRRGAGRRAAHRAALRARRAAGRLRRAAERRAHGDRPQPHRAARGHARRAGGELRPLPADDGARPRARRPAHRRGRRGGRLRRRRAELPGDGRRGARAVGAAATGGRAAAVDLLLDRRGAALRAPQPGAAGLVRDRPVGDDVRDAARALPGAGDQRLRRGRQRDRPAVRVGLGRRRRGGADDALARSRARASGS